MRRPPYNAKRGLMRYGIREVVDVAQRLSELDPDFRFVGENIGDPVAKGWMAPDFVRDILVDLIHSNNGKVFGYTHSRGRVETRKWVAAHARKFAPSVQLDYEDVIFSNGVGSGLSCFYRMLASETRIIQPNPGYPAHTSTERFSAGAESISYLLDPENGWQPDLEHLEHQVKSHPEVVGILLINPNNPTGAVYTADTLETIIGIAERYGLMLVSDEVYFRLVFNGAEYIHISELASGRVPLVVMRGVSKDVPWTGARCGWMEFHNLNLDEDFRIFFESIKKPVMMEVCATTLPQTALPLIYEHPGYPEWLRHYNAELEANSNSIADILGGTPGISVNPIQGAFYVTVLFDAGILNGKQSLPISNPAAQEFISEMVSDPALPLDKRFTYYLLASTGICVVPISDFECPSLGFRVTTLERNAETRNWCYKTLSDAIVRYSASG
ncbi:pyridoxal phosphate-dependent aminotransferase [Verrucomicrobiota bacterium]